MPIGKNSLKRVTNNGYSAVKTAAPDMENSTVVTEPAATEPTTKVAPVSKKTTAKGATPKTVEAKPAAKSAAKSTSKKPATKTTAKKPTTAKAETKPAAKPENKIPRAPETASRIIARAEGEKGYCNLGDELPVHLL